MAVTMIIGIVVAIVELVITIKRKAATKKTKKGNLHIFADLKKAMENTKKRKATAEEEAEAAV